VQTYTYRYAPNNMEPKRLNKYISDTGFCSRRDADELIEQGRVTVNGKIPADAGMKVTPKDKVRIDDEILSVKEERPVYLIFNKPANMSATSDPSVRDNVVRAINFPATLEPTGLLEREAEGIIFLSNDSDFVRNIKRSDNKYEKEYVVTVDKQITADFLQKISGGGAPLPGEERKNNAVSKEAQTRFRITLKPGTDHYLKRMCESLGYKIMHLQRLRFDTFTLGKLPAGHWRVLTQQEVKSLTSLAYPGKGASAKRSGDSSYNRPEPTERREGARAGAGKRSSADKASSTSTRGGADWPAGASARSGAGRTSPTTSRGGADRKSSSTSRGGSDRAGGYAQGEGAYKRGTQKSGTGSSAKTTRGSSGKGAPKSGPAKSSAPKTSSKRNETPKRGR
jgi:23S rRNA pseudouridine2604 synthase